MILLLLHMCIIMKLRNWSSSPMESGSYLNNYHPVIIDRTIRLVFGPFTTLYRPFLKRCILTNKAVGTIWRALSIHPGRRYGKLILIHSDYYSGPLLTFEPELAYIWARPTLTNVTLFPGVLWLWHFLYSVGPHPMSSLHIYTFVVSRAFMAGCASQAGDADSSRAPGLTSGLQVSVNIHRGALLLVPQWQCISSFVFYIYIFLTLA